MKTYIAILRGINVSGQKKIRMEELREALASLGFSNVVTYIQSGNVIFNFTPEKNGLLELKIHEVIKQTFGFEVPVIVRTKKEWEQLVNQNSFLNRPDVEKDKLHATILSRLPDKALVNELADLSYLPDEFNIDNKVVYVYCPNGYGKTKLNNTFFEKKLNVSATTRNWKTTVTLLEMAKGSD